MSEAPGMAQVCVCPRACLSVQHCCSLGLIGGPHPVPALQQLPLLWRAGQDKDKTKRPQGSGRSVLKGCRCPGEGGMCCALGLKTF